MGMLLLLALLQEDGRTVVVRKNLEGLGKHLGTVTRSHISMVWVVDRSPSMTDDRARVSAELDTVFANLPPEKKVRMAVVAYDEKAVVVAPLTPDRARIKEALLNVGTAGGGREKVANALATAAALFSDAEAQPVLVIMTDEKGDDDAGLEKAAPALRKGGIRTYVFGREAVFGWPQAYERDEASNILVPIDAGPESAGLETLQVNPLCCVQKWEPWCRKMLMREEIRRAMSFFDRDNPEKCHLGFDQAVPSGFGCFALERLCRETGGAYFLLHDKPAYKTLEGYEPEWITMDEWRARNAKDPMRKAILAILHDIEEGKTFNLPCKFSGEGEGGTIARRVPEVEKQFAAWIELLGRLDKEIVATGEGKPYRRWEAHRDLLEAQLWAMLHYLEQYRLALAEGPYPKDAPDGVWIATRKEIRGAGELKARALEKLAAIKKDHAGTPWAKTADLLSKNLLGFEIHPARYGNATPKTADR